jgi:peptidyl-prolyl cis-trans isomerase D
VLEGLVADKVLLAEANRMGLLVTDEELRREILKLPVFQQGGEFIGQEDYARILRQNGYQVDSFESDMRKQLLTLKVRTVLSDNLYVPESDILRSYKDQVEQAKIRYLVVDASTLASSIQLEPGEVEEYFDKVREDFRVPERRVVDYLLIDRRSLENTVEVGETEVEAFYQENVDEFTREEQVQARHILLQTTTARSAEEARSQLEAVRRRIEAGEDFAAIAAEVSEDPGSKTRGGDLGFFGREDMVKPFADAAFGAQPGTLVGPVQTDFGLHLIEVQSRQEGGTQPLAEVENQIRQRLAAERSAAVADSKARELADRIASENLSPESWAELAAGEEGVSFATTPAFGRDDSVPEIGRSTDFSVEAFERPPGDISAPVAIGRGWAVLSVRSVEPPRLPEIDEVRAQVEDKLQKEKQGDEAIRQLEAARAEIAAGQSFEQIAAAYELEPKESDLFGRAGPVISSGNNPLIGRAALELDVGDTGGPLRINEGALLFEVLERQHFDPVTFESEKESTLASLRTERFVEFLGSLVETRREELGVRYDPNLLQNLGLDGEPAG